jgi:hypothetical protein
MYVHICTSEILKDAKATTVYAFLPNWLEVLASAQAE